MPRLSELTSRAAVEESLTEFRATGRQTFLETYGFQPSRDFFIRVEEELFDSKPVIAVAYGKQFPDRGPLAATSFSGGVGGTVRALRRLGFDVVTRANLSPPRIGDEHSSRTAIYETFGGDRVAGIIRFPGEAVVNVFSDADGPYADEPPTLASEFGYRGEGLIGNHRVEAGGNALLEAARLDRSAVRFWHRPRGGSFVFFTWAAVLGRAWVSGIGQDNVERLELEWTLLAVPGRSEAAWPKSALEAIDDDVIDTGSAVIREIAQAKSYDDMLQLVEGRAQPKKTNGRVRADYQRSAVARRAVLLRSKGMCESPRCTGMPPELNRQGGAILDVDHVLDLALGGNDHPLNMVALCPNCHAAKTRGRNAPRWRRELLKAARYAHENAVGIPE